MVENNLPLYYLIKQFIDYWILIDPPGATRLITPMRMLSDICDRKFIPAKRYTTQKGSAGIVVLGKGM